MGYLLEKSLGAEKMCTVTFLELIPWGLYNNPKSVDTVIVTLYNKKLRQETKRG